MGAATHGQCVAVDAATGVTTGISAADGARTARIVAHPSTTPGEWNRPGHLVPMRVRPDLCARALPAVALTLTAAACDALGAVYADLVFPGNSPRMASANEASDFAAVHGLVVLDARALGFLSDKSGRRGNT
ncbi:3,4-dihydroxy-2-butanone-4-phosphate synthase [Gordonia aquimaris]|uniref:3,4-dihydroxy-2-butanone-4-phosphate synthase n=1 Tax=Gordonia aquimaris TaxID=2984863 RepID=UPI003556CA10